ncbi:hypothetical protein RJ639_045283 [Escallonia herrerae]|uniref:Protein TIFY n=1 Tax=Escallonia herrerae TaxID=1293975 RepID=A0AA88WA60_9ASTE|nr:hypothetical protein RJ639_045283 [Escallonia herrerae]
MSKLQRFSDLKKPGKAPEKSNFAQTCSLLSQYLKERGSLRDLNLGINGKLDAKGRPEAPPDTDTATMNLLTSMEKSGDGAQKSTQGVIAMDLLPQYVGTMDFSTAKVEPKPAQMTMFYAGQVLVFDDFPAEKAREIMSLATKGNLRPTSLDENDLVGGGDSIASVAPSGSEPPQERLQPQPTAVDSDLPIARRSSLHRFLEKRKGRVTARAPYQVVHHSSPAPASPKHEEQLELKL